MANTPLPFILDLFCDSGNVTAVPVLGSGVNTGQMSYQYGFTPNYELDLLTDPNALPVPRVKMNQVLLDITNACRQFQWQGTPAWISPGSGGPTGYLLYSYVLYDAGSGNQVWESQTGTVGSPNTSVPGADNNWRVVSGGSQGVPVGTIIDFGGIAAPTGYIACDGSAVSRATYGALKSAITQIQTVTLTNTVATFTATSATGLYIGMSIEGTGIPSSTTISNIVGTTVTMSNAATTSASSAVTFFNWGNGNGTTTFNVPDLRRYTTIGAGGSGSATVGSVSGQRGGSESQVLVSANMPSGTPVNVNASGNFLGTSGSDFNTPGTTSGSTVYTNGSGTAVNIMQPSAVTFKCIKF